VSSQFARAASRVGFFGRRLAEERFSLNRPRAVFHRTAGLYVNAIRNQMRCVAEFTPALVH
jgi:hypothetical protein